MPRARIAALIALAVLTTPGCARAATEIGASQAHADPTTTPSTPSAFPPEKIDSLLLSLDEVNKALAPLDHPFFANDPVRDQPDDLQVAGPAACGAPVTVGTKEAIGRDWNSYRSALYVGEENAMVELVVAVYKDRSTAEGAFARVADAARICKPNPELVVESTTNDTVRWHVVAVNTIVGSSEETRLIGNVIVQVKAARTGKDSQAARQIPDLVVKRIQEH